MNRDNHKELDEVMESYNDFIEKVKKFTIPVATTTRQDLNTFYDLCRANGGNIRIGICNIKTEDLFPELFRNPINMKAELSLEEQLKLAEEITNKHNALTPNKYILTHQHTLTRNVKNNNADNDIELDIVATLYYRVINNKISIDELEKRGFSKNIINALNILSSDSIENIKNCKLARKVEIQSLLIRLSNSGMLSNSTLSATMKALNKYLDMEQYDV